jgi:hypothetical protein
MSSTPEAFWGPLVLSNGKPSPMLTRISIALCDFMRATAAVQTMRQPASTARTLLMPETFLGITELFNIEIFPFSQFGLSTVTTDMLDITCVEFYTLLGMPFEMGSREASPGARETPLLLRSGLAHWLAIACSYNPEGFGARFSNILQAESVKIYDPMTDAPFEHTVVPRSCLPQADHPEAVRAWDSAQEQLKRGISEFISLRNHDSQMRVSSSGYAQNAQNAQNEAAAFARLQGTVAAMPPNDPYAIAALQNLNNQQNAMMAHQAQENARHQRAMMGGWEYDSQGNRRWIQGWIQ